MKLIKYSFLYLVIAFVCAKEDALSQAKWVPKSISIGVPAKETYTQYSQCPNESGRDTSYSIIGSVYLSYSSSEDYVTSYSRIGNTISIDFNYSSQSGYCLGIKRITFTLDSIGGKLQDIFISNSTPDYQNAYGCKDATINISSIDFVLSRDTLLIATDTNSSFKNKITGITYRYTWWDLCRTDPGPHHGQWHKGYSLDALLDSTSGYFCSITLVIPQLVNSVNKSNINPQNILVSNSEINNSIHFSFPSSDHPQPLTIYDILGREIKRIEIPSGVSEYRLQRDGFMSGYYFARLGSQSASFIVN